MGSFILFVLWMVGLIVISIELWGPTGSVNGNCNLYVTSGQSSGPNTNALAWLEQHSICEYFCTAVLMACFVSEERGLTRWQVKAGKQHGHSSWSDAYSYCG
jgi:hypothetical protein